MGIKYLLIVLLFAGCADAGEQQAWWKNGILCQKTYDQMCVCRWADRTYGGYVVHGMAEMTCRSAHAMGWKPD